MVQVAEHLPCKHKALSSNSSTEEKNVNNGEYLFPHIFSYPRQYQATQSDQLRHSDKVQIYKGGSNPYFNNF
jgi:hypothetical protein